VTGFALSPGITPALTDVFVVELPILLGVGYFLGRRRGFEVVFALNAIALGAVKLYTDWADPPDVVISVAAVASGAGWLLALANVGAGGVRPRGAFPGAGAIGVFGLAAGAWKAWHDFYDPFDLLLADAALISGLALIAYALRRVWPALRWLKPAT
jgi:hypothetical protein